MPQLIYEIPVDGKPINEGTALGWRQLVQRVVVGPCLEPQVATRAIKEALRAAKLDGPKVVTFCGVPYREKV